MVLKLSSKTEAFLPVLPLVAGSPSIWWDLWIWDRPALLTVVSQARDSHSSHCPWLTKSSSELMLLFLKIFFLRIQCCALPHLIGKKLKKKIEREEKLLSAKMSEFCRLWGQKGPFGGASLTSWITQGKKPPQVISALGLLFLLELCHTLHSH